MDIIEASRRVGWARYYDTVEHVDELQADLDHLRLVARNLCRQIIHHNRLLLDDPLVTCARAILDAI